MKKKIIFLLIILIFLATVGIVYLNRFFFPVKFKEIVIKEAQQLLKREVKFDSLQFHPIKGFVITNLQISDKTDPSAPFIVVKEVSFNLLYAPIFKSRKIVIPSLVVRQPSVYLTHLTADEWNFSDLLKPKEQKKGQNPFSFSIGGVKIEDGQMVLLDKTVEPPFLETFEETNLKATLSLKKGLKFFFETTLTQSSASFSLEGTAGLPVDNFNARLTALNFPLAKYLNLYFKNENFRLENGLIEFADVQIQRENKMIASKGQMEFSDVHLFLSEKEIAGHFKSPQFDFILKPDHQLTLNGQFGLERSSIKFADKTFAGNLLIDQFVLASDGDKTDAKGNVQLTNFLGEFPNNRKLSGQLRWPDASVSWTKEKTDLAGTINIQNLNLQLDQKTIKGQLHAIPTRITFNPAGDIEFTGAFEINDAKVSLEKDRSVAGQITATETTLTFLNKELSLASHLKVNDASIVLGPEKFLRGQISADQFLLNLAQDTLHIKSTFKVAGADIQLKDIHVTGDPDIDLQFEYNPQLETPASYYGTVKPHIRLMTGIPIVNEISSVEGRIDIDKDRFETGHLRLITQNTEVNLSGSLTNLLSPILNIKASTERIDLQKILTLFPKLKEKIKVDVSGLAKLNVQFDGPINPFNKENIKVGALISEGTLSGGSLPSAFTEVAGEIHYADDALDWKNLNAKFKDFDLVLDGRLVNFAQPSIQTRLKSTQLGLDMNSSFNVIEENIQFKTFNGKLHESNFDLTGSVDLTQQTSPLINVSGRAELNLNDLNRFPQFEKLKSLKLGGLFYCDLAIKGPATRWKEWTAVVNAKSPEFLLKEYKFQNISMQLDQSKGDINSLDIWADVYDGKLKIHSLSHLMEEGMPYQLEAAINNSKLETFKKDTQWKDNDISGTLSGVLHLSGNLNALQLSTGDGSLLINQGKIWQVNLFKGLGKLLFIPEYRDITFHEASTDFKIQGERILTNNLMLNSDSMVLAAKGWLKFSGELEFNVLAEFQPKPIEESESIKKAITSFLAQTGRYMNIKVSGSLKDPNYAILPSPLNMMEKTKDLLIEGIQNIF